MFMASFIKNLVASSSELYWRLLSTYRTGTFSTVALILARFVGIKHGDFTFVQPSCLQTEAAKIALMKEQCDGDQ
jgi:hypothetical protein